MNDKVIKAQILLIALFSRVTILVLQALSNTALPDHEADAFHSPKPKSQNGLERNLYLLVEGLERWDGQHFLTVAEFGYVFEKDLAFFPLLPFLMYLITNSFFLPLQALVNYHIVLMLSAITLNLLLFPIAALSLFEVSRSVLRDHKRAFTTTLLFCFNPASIFFSAIYSETLFSCLVFTALRYYHKRSNIIATLLFFLATCTRSNGILNGGFLIYNTLTFLPLISKSHYKWTKWIVYFAIAVLQSFVVILAFLLFQYYAYKLFCEWPSPQLSKSILRLAMENPDEYVVRGQYFEWCSSSFPMPYAYIQERYWNVGFLRYFQLKQIPNFMLAFPAVVLCFHGIFQFAIQVLRTTNKFKLSQRNLEIIPYVVHCSFLLVFGITSVHVQVVTRLLTSSTPIFYWFAASHIPDVKKGKDASKKRKINHMDTPYLPFIFYYREWKNIKVEGKLVLTYFLSYYLIGIVSFSNYLPWT